MQSVQCNLFAVHIRFGKARLHAFIGICECQAGRVAGSAASLSGSGCYIHPAKAEIQQNRWRFREFVSQDNVLTAVLSVSAPTAPRTPVPTRDEPGRGVPGDALADLGLQPRPAPERTRRRMQIRQGLRTSEWRRVERMLEIRGDRIL